MPRMPRNRSKSGIYHVVMRGINHHRIFEDDEDCIRFIETIKRFKKACGFELYAYCLMGNHIHLLIMEGNEHLGETLRRICASYVLWYNRKYERVGYLFQDRYKSETVESDRYFLTVLRYIYQNPVKAALVTSVEEYKWSNYYEYMENNKKNHTDFVLSLFDNNREGAVKSFIEFINKQNDDICLDIPQKNKITDDEAKSIIMKLCRVNGVNKIQNLDIPTRNLLLKELKEKHYLSIRQIERVTGISRGIVMKA